MDDCRMKRSLHPRKGKVVMVRVEEVSVETNTASVSLVEYGSIRGTLTFTDADRVEVIAGRTEPALVSNVTRSFRQRTPPRRRISFRGFVIRRQASILLTLEGITEDERNNCEMSFTKALHVRSVLHHLARTRGSTLQAGLQVYTPSTSDVELNVEVLPEDDYLKSQWNEFIKLRLLSGPMAASVIWFPSYCGRNIGPNEILSPTDEELAQFLANNEEAFVVHCMLLTGHGMDEHGREYWEMQDSYGNVRNGDRGYLRVYLGQDPISIIEYVVIQRA